MGDSQDICEINKLYPLTHRITEDSSPHSSTVMIVPHQSHGLPPIAANLASRYTLTTVLGQGAIAQKQRRFPSFGGVAGEA